MKEWTEYSLMERAKVWGVVGICVVINMWGIGRGIGYGGIEGYEMDRFEKCVYECEKGEDRSVCNLECLVKWDEIATNHNNLLNELRGEIK